jgi:hypothetical protein
MYIGGKYHNTVYNVGQPVLGQDYTCKCYGSWHLKLIMG